MIKHLRLTVFLPSFVLLICAVAFALIEPDLLVEVLDGFRIWILQHFDWLFNWVVFVMVIAVIGAYVSPLGAVRIGGADAKPILPKFKWFSIVLCTTIATGILFWGSAEPLYHTYEPPSGDLQAGAMSSAVAAMSTLYMHWTFSPYAIYTSISLLFALAYYQYKLPFKVSSVMMIFSKSQDAKWYHDALDGVCLFALVAGMAASLGAGVLTLSGGIHNMTDIIQGPFLFGIITLLIVAAFVASASSGLQRGIKWLSTINVIFFIFLIAVFGLLMIDMKAITLAGNGIVEYVVQFVPRSLGLDGFDSAWRQSWTSFYWANWMAWAPVSALFLGRLALGYTVREFIRINLVYTSLFSIVWMSIFGGVALSWDLSNNGDLYQMLSEGGPQVVIFFLMEEMPYIRFGSVLILIIVFISYVTSADSNTSAMSGLSSDGVNPEKPEAPISIKLLWGSLIAIMSWVMISYAGIEGIRILSVIGGFPILFFCILFVGILIRIIIKSISEK